MDYQLSQLSCAAKTLIGFFIISLLIGYGVALLQTEQHTHFDVNAIIQDYRGSPDPEAMIYPKPYEELLQLTHAHALSVPVVYFLLSALFLGSALSQKNKSLLIALLFTGFFLDYISLWGLRYLSAGFVYLSFLSNGVSGLIYLFMCGRVLWDLKSKKEH